MTQATKPPIDWFTYMMRALRAADMPAPERQIVLRAITKAEANERARKARSAQEPGAGRIPTHMLAVPDSWPLRRGRPQWINSELRGPATDEQIAFRMGVRPTTVRLQRAMLHRLHDCWIDPT